VEVVPARAALRLLLLILAAYGPLAPVVIVMLTVVPPLLVLSGWPWWIVGVLLASDVGILLVTALWLGPQVQAEIREYAHER
jgi:predicted outer membrane lipoprotein